MCQKTRQNKNKDVTLTSLRKCKTCDVVQQVQEFPIETNNYLGRAYYCRECFLQKRRIREERRNQNAQSSDELRQCRTCDHVAPISEYPQQKGNKYNRSYYCKYCFYHVYKRKHKKKNFELGKHCVTCKQYKSKAFYPTAISRTCTQCHQAKGRIATQIQKKRATVRDEYGNIYKEYIKGPSASDRRWMRADQIDRGELVQCDHCFNYSAATKLRELIDSRKVCLRCVRKNHWEDEIKNENHGKDNK